MSASKNLRLSALALILVSVIVSPALAMTTTERDQKLDVLKKVDAEWRKSREQWEKELAHRERTVKELREKTDISSKIKAIEEKGKETAKKLPAGLRAAISGNTAKASKAALEMGLNYVKQQELAGEMVEMMDLEKEYGEKIANQEKSIKSLEAAIKVSNDVIALSQQEIAILNATPTIPEAPKWLVEFAKAARRAETRVRARKEEEARKAEQGKGSRGSGTVDRPDKPGPDKPGPDKPGPDKPGPDKPGPDKPRPDKPRPDKPRPIGPPIDNRKG